MSHHFEIRRAMTLTTRLLMPAEALHVAPTRGAGRGAGRRRGGGIGLAALVTEPGWEKAEDTQPPVLQPFREATGPTEPLPYDARAIDFFSKMVGDDFFEKLADATNANAVSCRSAAGGHVPLRNKARRAPRVPEVTRCRPPAAGRVGQVAERGGGDAGEVA